MGNKTFEDLPIEKLYYSISEVSKILTNLSVSGHNEISNSKIRYWLYYFELHPRRSAVKQNRIFDINDINDLKEIYRLSYIVGYKLWAIKREFKIYKNKRKVYETVNETIDEETPKGLL